jgi:hypothetical protein
MIIRLLILAHVDGGASLLLQEDPWRDGRDCLRRSLGVKVFLYVSMKSEKNLIDNLLVGKITFAEI